ncbi:hypothetical protein O6H91_13G007700 [Diphasiastrum complanatum]|uniref:Uncharacterized protein n=1 Tax=Diphasiastrum complanatum TaxID=34168 RepID=A0ACC2BRV9_DIPCM|nr:hypothetical protein O6H91_13G007700 [Diphasiastrum complanatum]
MDGLPRDELERLVFFETAREKAASDYLKNPTDADNLTRWGGALLELAHFRQGQDSVDMIEEAVSKLQEALKINSRKHDTLWCLGNAHTAQGFLISESDKANACFKKATLCFQQAVEEEPLNDLYQKALEMSAKAPALYIELQKQLASQQVVLGGSAGPVSGGSSKSTKKKKNNTDLKYDILGWIVLAVGVVAWVGMAKSMPPPTQNLR